MGIDMKEFPAMYDALVKKVEAAEEDANNPPPAMTLEDLDEDGDGKVSYKELEVEEEDDEEFFEKIFAKADASKDGFLDSAELEVFNKLLEDDAAGGSEL